MRFGFGTFLMASALATATLAGAPARASDFVDGHLVFANDALATYSFESIQTLAAAGASHIAWQTIDGRDELLTTPIVSGDEKALLVDDALEGQHGLKIAATNTVGVALRDDTTFTANASRRISVSMWGRARGAEPVLELLYAHSTTEVGPQLIHVTAIRTGRETEDGWVEYSTGPVDATALGVGNGTPLRAIVLSARYATTAGISALVDEELGPTFSTHPKIEAADGFAVIDAVEIRPEPGDVAEPTACTMADVATKCADHQDCMFGHCVDGALLWGPVPAAADHRSDLVARWAFVAENIQSDRQSIELAKTAFGGAAATLAKETTPRRFFAKLNELVGDLHDSHTRLGTPPSNHSVLWPFASTSSGPTDACFGVATNDLGDGSTVFAVFDVGSNALIGATLQKGDVVTAIDGMAPTDWLDLVAPRLGSEPPDPGARPSYYAISLGEVIGRFARTLTLSRCTSGGCTALPDINIADPVFAGVQSGDGTGGYSLSCALRFQPSVSNPPPDSGSNLVVEETVGGITSVQFDGFESPYDSSMMNPYAAWEDPMTTAFSSGGDVLVDARLGWGGYFTTGKFLFDLLRGTDQPYGMFALPRGAFDDPDPPWLLSNAFDACPTNPSMFAPTLCQWDGGQLQFTESTSPPGEAAKIAWINGNDVSMNDIVPRLMQGRTNFRVFGPHPTHGSYGEIAKVPRIGMSWTEGSIQVLDMRFGTSPADARTQRWESGHGVVPDVVVAQKVSDILVDQDTVLSAAKAWLLQ
jgi:hypothetical protein